MAKGFDYSNYIQHRLMGSEFALWENSLSPRRNFGSLCGEKGVNQ